MARFIPEDKLSRKARKKLNRQRRRMWEQSPVSRVIESKKIYNRKRSAHVRYDGGMNASCLSRVFPLIIQNTTGTFLFSLRLS